MFDSIGNTVFTIVVFVIIVYLIIWTMRFIANQISQNAQLQEDNAREKQQSIRKRTIACSKNYWFNRQDVEDCPHGVNPENYYHYFETEQQCIKELILEMYFCGYVHTDEIKRIAFGDEPVNQTENKVEYDPYAVDNEYDEFEYDLDEAVEELMLVNEEELKAAAESADDHELRAQIYDCWASYVVQLFDMVTINCNEEMKLHIRSKIMSYGHKDAEILIHSPEQG